MKNFICNVINQITKGACALHYNKGLRSYHHFPSASIHPGQLIANECTVVLHGEIGIHVMKILGIQADTLHHAGHRPGLGKLGVLYCEGELIGDDFPTHFSGKREWNRDKGMKSGIPVHACS